MINSDSLLAATLHEAANVAPGGSVQNNSYPELMSRSTHAHRQRLVKQATAIDALPLPSAITSGSTHVIEHANRLFASFLGCLPEELEGRLLASVCREPGRMTSLLKKAYEHEQPELADQLAYATPRGVQLANTMAVPLFSSDEPWMLVQVVEPPPPASERRDFSVEAAELRLANERLLLASLREHGLAERAEAAAREVRSLLQRKTVLAEINALLSASLDLGETLAVVARLALPQLADFCIVQLNGEGEAPRLALAHNEPAVEARLRAQLDRLADDEAVVSLRRRVLASPERWLSCGLPQGELATPASPPSPATFAESGAAHALAIPLRVRDKALGVLMLFSCKAERVFLASDVDFALELAARASVAIDNALLYREARQAVRLRDDVLAIVSHDLRSPLGAITMTTQALLREGQHKSVEAKRSYDLILRSSRHMRRLIEELLEVASLQMGQLVLQKERVELAHLVQEAFDMFESSAQQKGVQLVQRSIAATQLTCDAERVLRVLANLIGNAIKYTPRAGVIELFVEQLGHEVQVRVRDSGPGVSERDQQQLFAQYWKGNRAGRTSMGLGLYIARGIIEAHGGRIWVESTPPRGSTFVFTLPCLD
jgi:signal transduction histidine kinase